jgi:Chalcone isomerase-like
VGAAEIAIRGSQAAAMVVPQLQWRTALVRASGLLGLATSFALSATPTVPAIGATCGGAEFPDSLSSDGVELLLNGLGVRKATFLNIEVYVAALYLPQKSTNAAQILGT